MSSESTSQEMSILSMEITTIHIDGEPTIHIEQFFDINELEKVGLKLHKTLLLCGARCYFNEQQLIHQKIIKIF